MRRHLTPRLLFSLLCVFLAFLIPLSLYIGVVKIPLSSLFSSEIIIEMRAPRITMAFLVGSSLAVAGAVVQGVFRNPLAEPYLLGISSGAILGYSLSFFFREELAIPLAFLFSTFPISLNTSSLRQLLITFEHIVCQPAEEMEDERHNRGEHDSFTTSAIPVDANDRRAPNSAGADMEVANPNPAAKGVPGRRTGVSPDGDRLESGGAR